MGLDQAFWIVVGVLYQVSVVLFPHPDQIEQPLLRELVRFLGRLSLLRHTDSPGTFHLPLTRQPPPTVRLRGVIDRLPPLKPLCCVGALLLLLSLPGCASLARPRFAVAAALKDLGAAGADLRAFSGEEEEKILRESKTQEEARGRLDSFRKAVDYSYKILNRASGQLHDVKASLDGGRRP